MTDRRTPTRYQLERAHQWAAKHGRSPWEAPSLEWFTMAQLMEVTDALQDPPTRADRVRRAVDAGLLDAGAKGIDHFVTLPSAREVIGFVTARVMAVLEEEDA